MTPYDGAAPETTEPSANRTAPAARTRRWPKPSPSRPTARIETAYGRTYALTVHASSDWVVPNAWPIVGSARLTMLRSMFAVKAARAATAISDDPPPGPDDAPGRVTPTLRAPRRLIRRP